MMMNVLRTVMTDPPKGGMCTPRNRAATHPPTGVPANGGPSTAAVVAVPLLANVTAMRPDPVGPSGFLHDCEAVAAAESAESAAARSKSPLPPAAGAAGAGAAGAGAGAATGGGGKPAGAAGVVGFSALGVAATLRSTFSASTFGGGEPGATAAGAVSPEGDSALAGSPWRTGSRAAPACSAAGASA